MEMGGDWWGWMEIGGGDGDWWGGWRSDVRLCPKVHASIQVRGFF